MNYKVCYECKDGCHLSFTFESDHRIVRDSQINVNSNPLLREVCARISERKANPKNKMHQHGGYKKTLYIKNTDTGTIQYYDLF